MQALALAVLRQAIDDALGNCAGTEGGGNAARTDGRRTRAQQEGLAFWQDIAGPWAASRATWCEMAGVDPDYTRMTALRRIALGPGFDADGKPITRKQTGRERARAKAKP